MTAHRPAGLGPLHEPPSGPHLVESGRRLALLEALGGVELGPYDEHVVVVLARDATGTPDAVVSWLERVRRAGHEAGMRRVAALVKHLVRDLVESRGQDVEPGESNA